MKQEKALVWFRRDLRDEDHAALAAALSEAKTVYAVFVFDREILDALPDKADRRVEFIHASVVELDEKLRARGGQLIVRHGWSREEIPALAARLGVTTVYASRDYEPAAKARDADVAARLASSGCSLCLLKDQVIFEQREILTQSGKPYTVFTPYKNAWLKRLTVQDHAAFPSSGALACWSEAGDMPSLATLGFVPTNLSGLGVQAGMRGARALWDEFHPARLQRYGKLRDFPAVKGVSYLSVHLRFGTISLRELVRTALAAEAESWLNELIWRDFYFMILDQFPHVVGAAFKPEYDGIVWAQGDRADTLFEAWCTGQTGYPLVDAAMRQLQHSGWMHNRLRMVVASFLTKDLGIDWRRGEAWFARHLNDFDLSANNGGWQWAASSGCDAQPYFRIFNPVTQSEKFDPDGKFIRRYVPEIAALSNKEIHAPWQAGGLSLGAAGVVLGQTYPAPIVDHAQAREETLARYAVVKKSAVT